MELRASNTQFSDRRIGQVLNVPDPLLQLVECDTAALEQGVGVNRGLDALRAAIQ